MGSEKGIDNPALDQTGMIFNDCHRRSENICHLDHGATDPFEINFRR